MGILNPIYNWGASQIRSFYQGETGGMPGCTPTIPPAPEREDAAAAAVAPTTTVTDAAAPTTCCTENSIMDCINGPEQAEASLRNQIMGEICVDNPQYIVGNSPDSVVLIRSNGRTGEARARQGTNNVELRIFGDGINFFTDSGELRTSITVELQLAEGLTGTNGISVVSVSVETVTVNGVEHRVLKISFNVAADAVVGRRNIVIKNSAGETISGDKDNNAFEVVQRFIGGGGHTPPTPPTPPTGNPFEL